MTDPKRAMLELALRAVQQHLERDEYTAAGEVVMQALARAEQLSAPDLRATFRDTMDSLDMAELAVQQEQRIAELESLVRRLLADHQRVEPHHADQCALCREAQAEIEGQPAAPEVSTPITIKELVKSVQAGEKWTVGHGGHE